MGYDLRIDDVDTELDDVDEAEEAATRDLWESRKRYCERHGKADWCSYDAQRDDNELPF